jgi:hypothetical protein
MPKHVVGMNKRNDFFIIKPTRSTNFTNAFCHETLHVSVSSSVHHQEFTYCTLSNDICLQTCMTCTIVKCKVNKLLTKDRGTARKCRDSCQNKFVKLVHLVGFIIKKFVMMHGHMNVKKGERIFTITVV